MKKFIFTIVLFFVSNAVFSQSDEKTSYRYNDNEEETTNIDSLLKRKKEIHSLAVYVYSDFSPKIYNFVNLDTLYIFYGSGKLPKGISKLRKLKYFELRDSEIEKLPDDIQYLNNLETIKILKGDNVKDIFIIPSYFAKMKSLKYLEFFDTEVKFSNETNIFKNIRELKIWQSGNRKFPINILQFPQLQFLGISCYRCDWKIPKEKLLQMPTLRYLKIEGSGDGFEFQR
jgi:hypothetical protein